jgi:hypothetical protein
MSCCGGFAATPPACAAATKLFAQTLAGHPTTGGGDLLTRVVDLRIGDGSGGRDGGVLPAMVNYLAVTRDASQASDYIYD